MQYKMCFQGIKEKSIFIAAVVVGWHGWYIADVFDLLSHDYSALLDIVMHE